jgi:hypothetical protein
MLFLYEFKSHIILSHEALVGIKYNLIRVFDEIGIENRIVHLSKLPVHPANTNLFSARLGYMCIIDQNQNIKVFEPFDVLKEYEIAKTDIAFELYLINGVLKVHPYPFSFGTYYMVCPVCRDLILENVLLCNVCRGGMCKECNLFGDQICDKCNLENVMV